MPAKRAFPIMENDLRSFATRLCTGAACCLLPVGVAQGRLHSIPPSIPIIPPILVRECILRLVKSWGDTWQRCTVRELVGSFAIRNRLGRTVGMLPDRWVVCFNIPPCNLLSVTTRVGGRLALLIDIVVFPSREQRRGRMYMLHRNAKIGCTRKAGISNFGNDLYRSIPTRYARAASCIYPSRPPRGRSSFYPTIHPHHSAYIG